jgi:hypothetical protein
MLSVREQGLAAVEVIFTFVAFAAVGAVIAFIFV